MDVTVGIIVVAYKNPAMTIRFVKEEIPKIKSNKFLVIVNVAATEEESIELANNCQLTYGGRGALNPIKLNEKGVLIWTPENLGYAKGNNFAVNYLKEHKVNCAYYLFSNDDIEILSTDLLTSLIKKADSNSNIAGIGPRVKCIDGVEGSPERNYYSPYSIIKETVKNKFFGIKRYSDPNDIKEGQVYWVSGAFMLVKASWFNLVKGFDKRTFLYYEEPILAERFKRYGGYFYYMPDVSILHYEGGSTKGVVKNKQKREIVEQSRILYYRDYIHVNSFCIFLYKIFCKIK